LECEVRRARGDDLERPAERRLVAEVAAVTPGRALEVGCGEGADAIWLV
jgi:ubiquinone/menaquinone biosynthesis C-methylase UbiE